MFFSFAQIFVNVMPFDNEFVAVSGAGFLFSTFFFVSLYIVVPPGLNLLHKIFKGDRDGLFTHK